MQAIFPYFIISTPPATRLLIEPSFIWLPAFLWHIVAKFCVELFREIAALVTSTTHGKHGYFDDRYDKGIRNWGSATGTLLKSYQWVNSQPWKWHFAEINYAQTVAQSCLDMSGCNQLTTCHLQLCVFGLVNTKHPLTCASIELQYRFGNLSLVLSLVNATSTAPVFASHVCNTICQRLCRDTWSHDHIWQKGALLLRPFRFHRIVLEIVLEICTCSAMQLKNTRHMITYLSPTNCKTKGTHPKWCGRVALPAKNQKPKPTHMKNWLQNIWNSFCPSWLCKKWGWGRKSRLTGCLGTITMGQVGNNPPAKKTCRSDVLEYASNIVFSIENFARLSKVWRITVGNHTLR